MKFLSAINFIIFLCLALVLVSCCTDLEGEVVVNSDGSTIEDSEENPIVKSTTQTSATSSDTNATQTTDSTDTTSSGTTTNTTTDSTDTPVTDCTPSGIYKGIFASAEKTGSLQMWINSGDYTMRLLYTIDQGMASELSGTSQNRTDGGCNFSFTNADSTFFFAVNLTTTSAVNTDDPPLVMLDSQKMDYLYVQQEESSGVQIVEGKYTRTGEGWLDDNSVAGSMNMLILEDATVVGHFIEGGANGGIRGSYLSKTGALNLEFYGTWDKKTLDVSVCSGDLTATGSGFISSSVASATASGTWDTTSKISCGSGNFSMNFSGTVVAE